MESDCLRCTLSDELVCAPSGPMRPNARPQHRSPDAPARSSPAARCAPRFAPFGRSPAVLTSPRLTRARGRSSSRGGSRHTSHPMHKRARGRSSPRLRLRNTSQRRNKRVGRRSRSPRFQRHTSRPTYERARGRSSPRSSRLHTGRSLREAVVFDEPRPNGTEETPTNWPTHPNQRTRQFKPRKGPTRGIQCDPRS